MGFSDLADRALQKVCTMLGDEVTYNPSVGSPVTINGVFNRQFVEIDPNTGQAIATNQPNLLVRLADLSSAPTLADTVTVNGVSYKVIDSQEDGEGGSLLLLHRAS